MGRGSPRGGRTDPQDRPYLVAACGAEREVAVHRQFPECTGKAKKDFSDRCILLKPEADQGLLLVKSQVGGAPRGWSQPESLAYWAWCTPIAFPVRDGFVRFHPH